LRLCVEMLPYIRGHFFTIKKKNATSGEAHKYWVT